MNKAHVLNEAICVAIGLNVILSILNLLYGCKYKITCIAISLMFDNLLFQARIQKIFSGGVPTFSKKCSHCIILLEYITLYDLCTVTILFCLSISYCMIFVQSLYYSVLVYHIV